MIIKISFYLLIIIGVGVEITQYVLGFISINLLVHSILMYSIFFGLYILFNRISILNKMFLKGILFASLGTLFFFYVQYFYKIDLCVIVVPANFTGPLTLRMNDRLSKNSIVPLDGVLVVELNRKGQFTTSSNFDIKFNTIKIKEKVNSITSSQIKFKFKNEELVTKEGGVRIITADIFKK